MYQTVPDRSWNAQKRLTDMDKIVGASVKERKSHNSHWNNLEMTKVVINQKIIEN